MQPFQPIVLAGLLSLSFVGYANIQSFTDLIQHEIPNAQLGIQIQNAQNGSILFQQQAFATLHPASNTKLITTFAALKLLGPDYQFKTNLLYEPHIKKGVLKSDVALQFLGDPTLTLKSYEDFIEALKQKNIHTIDGDLILDEQAFIDAPYPPGWTWDDFNFGYAVPITAINLEQNQIKIKLESAQTLKAKSKVELQAPSDLHVDLNSNLETVTESEANFCNFEVTQKAERFHVSGCWPLTSKPTVLSIANQDVKAHVKALLKKILNEKQIKLKGEIKEAASSLPLQKTFLSQPLKQIVATTLKDSNNFYAESLLKGIGYEMKGHGTFNYGLQAVHEFLQQRVGLNTHELVLKDGSGLSQYNLISANQISRLLFVIYHDDLYPIFKESLAIAGQDGTLGNRLKTFDLSGLLAAKTGTLSGHSALSGYLEQDGQTLIVSLLINNSVYPAPQLKALEDQVMLWLQHKSFS